VASYTTASSTCITPPVGPDTLVAPRPPTFFLTAFTSPTQCGFCDGTIVIHGVPPGTVDTIYYSLNGTLQSGSVVVAFPDSTLHMMGMCAGNYTGFSVVVGPCRSNVIGAADLINPKIHAIFTDVLHYGCHGDTEMYYNASTSAGELWYIWNFGDGGSDTATNPIHIFAQGVYTVTLIATNHYCSDSMKLTDSMLHPLKAAFIDSPALLCQRNPVLFTDASIGTGLSYLWEFGNGATSSLQNTQYTYTNSGAYKVELIVTDFVPCKDTAVQIVQVDSLSPVSISVTDSVLCKSTYVTFTGNYTSIGNTGVTWYFGDGDSIVNMNPVVHGYDSTGKFTVNVIACNDNNAVSRADR